MTDQPLLPPPEDPPEAPPVVKTAQPRDLVPWFYGLGFVILAGAIFYVWQSPSTPSETTTSASAIQAIEQHLTDIDGRLSRLEQRPTPDLTKIMSRIDALEGRNANDSQVAGRLDQLSGRIESLAARDQTAIDVIKQSIDALTGRVAGVEAKSGTLDASAKRLNRIARLNEASLALASGRAVGDLPGAPEALARFAHVAPPTEEQLRRSFQQYEKAALAAEQPDETQNPFVDRVLEKAQGLITIRRGDDVVVGNQSSVVLSGARNALDSDDLPGAVKAVETLTGQPGQVMAPWLAQAKGLLGARAALAEMADQA